MKPSDVGPWVMLILGSLTILGALYATVIAGQTRKSIIVLWIFGVAMVGIGSYGPVFLSDYGDFVNTLLSMNSSPSKETYQQAFDKVAGGKLSGDYGDIVVRYAVNHPVEGTDSLLHTSIRTAKDPAGRQVLLSADTLLTQKLATARLLSETVVRDTAAEQTIQNFDPATRSLVARSLLRLPPQERARLHIRQSTLERMREVAPRGH